MTDRPMETCPAITEPHICCNGPRDCGGTSDWCEHCAPGAFDAEGNKIDFGFDDADPSSSSKEPNADD